MKREFIQQDWYKELKKKSIEAKNKYHKNTSSEKDLLKPFLYKHIEREILYWRIKMPVGGRAIGKTGFSSGLSGNGEYFLLIIKEINHTLSNLYSYSMRGN